MACTSSDILKIANKLSDSNDEATLRTSISRSYYCAYHACLVHFDIADPRDLQGGSGGGHQKLSDYLEGENRAVSYILNSLRNKRVLADYNLSKDIVQTEAKSAIESVNKLLEKLSAP